MDNRFFIILLILILLLSLYVFAFPMWQMHMQMMGYYYPVYWIFVIALTLISLGILIFYYFTKPNPVSEKVHYVYPLTEEETSVVEFLKSNDYRSTQKEIQLHFGFTKVKTHRILRSLESKGVILRMKRGREMVVVLKKEEVS